MTIDQLDTIEWLNRAFHIENKIKALSAVREKNRAIAERCTANYENIGSSSGAHDNSQEKIIHQICDDDIKIQNEIELLLKVRNDIKTAISNLDDIELENILIMRYLACMSVTDIAETLHYDRKTIQRKHKVAIEKMSHNVLECRT